MKLLFLGTGAADWPPERPDGCEEFRRMSAALIDGTLLIDPGPQVPDALAEYGQDLSAVEYVINTHRHSDHFDEATVAALRAVGAVLTDFAPGEKKQLGRYTISAYAGNHATCEGTVHFLISDGNSTLFYGLDGAWLLYDEAQAIIAARPDLAVLDGTVGFLDGDYRIFEHNDLNMVLEMQKTLAPYVGRFCISHMARTLHTDHAALSAAMAAHGVVTAYDGLELTV